MLLEEARGAVKDAREGLSVSLGPDREPSLDPREVLLSLDSIQSMLENVRERRESALTLRAQADRLAEDWQEREVERRALVELEARARAQHRAELERQESAEMDEQALMREVRRRRRRESDSSGTDQGADNPGVSVDRLPTK